MSEESPVMRMQIDNQDEEEDEAADNVLQRFQMRRTWESRYKGTKLYIIHVPHLCNSNFTIAIV